MVFFYVSSPRGIVVALSIKSWKTTPSWEASFDLCNFSSWRGYGVCYSSLGHECSNNKHKQVHSKLHLIELTSHINSCTSMEHAHPSYAHIDSIANVTHTFESSWSQNSIAQTLHQCCIVSSLWAWPRKVKIHLG